MAWTRAQLEFRYLGIGPAAAHRFQELASHLLYPNPQLRPPPGRLRATGWGNRAVGVRNFGRPADAGGHRRRRSRPAAGSRAADWRTPTGACADSARDLMILNQESPSYDRRCMQQIARQIEAHAHASGSAAACSCATGTPCRRRCIESDPGRVQRGAERQPRIPAAAARQRTGERRRRPIWSPLAAPSKSRRGRCRFSNCRTSTGWAASLTTAASTRFI